MDIVHVGVLTMSPKLLHVPRLVSFVIISFPTNPAFETPKFQFPFIYYAHSHSTVEMGRVRPHTQPAGSGQRVQSDRALKLTRSDPRVDRTVSTVLWLPALGSDGEHEVVG